MQIIHMMSCTAQEYVSGALQKLIRPPEQCPHCGRSRALHALAYYGRYLSGIVGKITIRRFRCRYCGGSVSMLPSFIQPYRFLQNHLFDMFMDGRSNGDTVRGQELLERGWLQFRREIPDLANVIRTTAPRSPKSHDPERWWRFLRLQYGGAAMITQGLVMAFQRTMFGKYDCHRATPPPRPILCPNYQLMA